MDEANDVEDEDEDEDEDDGKYKYNVQMRKIKYYICAFVCVANDGAQPILLSHLLHAATASFVIHILQYPFYTLVTLTNARLLCMVYRMRSFV